MNRFYVCSYPRSDARHEIALSTFKINLSTHSKLRVRMTNADTTTKVEGEVAKDNPENHDKNLHPASYLEALQQKEKDHETETSYYIG